MEPIEFDGQNKELQKPHGMTDEECMPLPVHVSNDHVVSCWKARLWERIVFLFTGNLWIWIMTGSGTQPPIAPVIIKGSPIKITWRKLEIYKRGKWRETKFSKIKKGDIFRLFEPSGDPVKYNGYDLFVCTDKPYQQDIDGVKGNWVVPHDNYEGTI
jgi:hypothetical protein